MVERKHLVVCGVAAAACAAATGALAFSLSRILLGVFRESDFEAARLIAAVTALIEADSPDQEVPVELEMSEMSETAPGIYTYGALQELYFKRSVGGETDWLWSWDMAEWTPTHTLDSGGDFVLDPPGIIFITRLHLLSVVRRKIAAAAAAGSSSGSGSGSAAGAPSSWGQAPRIPPPVELPPWAAQQLQEVQQQRGSQLLQEWQQQEQQQSPRCSCDGSTSRGQGAGQGRPRHIRDAPDVLCCPITGQLMLQPVTLPGGGTFEASAVRTWLAKTGRDPTSGTPVSPRQLHPALLVRQMVEDWLAGRDPLGRDDDAAAAAGAAAAAAVGAAAGAAAAAGETEQRQRQEQM